MLRCVLARLCLPASPAPILPRLSCSWPLGTSEACSGVSSLLHTFSWTEYFSSKNGKTFLFAVAGALHLEINWAFQSGTLVYGRLLDAHNFQEQRAKTLLFFFSNYHFEPNANTRIKKAVEKMLQVYIQSLCSEVFSHPRNCKYCSVSLNVARGKQKNYVVT